MSVDTMPELPDDPVEATTVTPTELYQELVEVGELILTVPAEEEDKLRKGLASAKNKQNAKMKEAGMPIDNSVLSFITTASADFEGAVQVHITLAKRQGVRVLAKEYPNPDF